MVCLWGGLRKGCTFCCGSRSVPGFGQEGWFWKIKKGCLQMLSRCWFNSANQRLLKDLPNAGAYSKGNFLARLSNRWRTVKKYLGMEVDSAEEVIDHEKTEKNWDGGGRSGTARTSDDIIVGLFPCKSLLRIQLGYELQYSQIEMFSSTIFAWSNGFLMRWTVFSQSQHVVYTRFFV